MNQKGFSLIETVATLGVMTIVSLGHLNVMSNMNSSIAYLEDKLEAVDTAREVRMTFTDASCTRSVLGLQAPQKGQVIDMADLKTTTAGKPLKTGDQKGQLKIGQIQLKNISIEGNDSSGLAEIIIPLQRKRKGGGPSNFKPIVIPFNMHTDDEGKITHCGQPIKDQDSVISFSTTIDGRWTKSPVTFEDRFLKNLYNGKAAKNFPGDFNFGGGFDQKSGIFTAPVAGHYNFSIQFRFKSSSYYHAARQLNPNAVLELNAGCQIESHSHSKRWASDNRLLVAGKADHGLFLDCDESYSLKKNQPVKFEFSVDHTPQDPNAKVFMWGHVRGHLVKTDE